LLSAEPCPGFHFKVLSRFLLAVSEPGLLAVVQSPPKLVNTLMNLPYHEGIPGSHRPDCRIAPRSPCSTCPPSNYTHQLHTGLPTSVTVACSLLPRLHAYTTNEPIPEARQLWSPNTATKPLFQYICFSHFCLSFVLLKSLLVLNKI
ncbi:hypothetical protein ILYODFUR_026378, partial [Ilyodon furcidens]